MPARSIAQRRLFGMLEHNPEMAAARGINMTQKQMHDYAATPESGLPSRKQPKFRGARKMSKKKYPYGV